jgi:CRISPR system Cascade subunit CasE
MPMYLSRIELAPERRETMKALASPQIMHAAVEECFSGSWGKAAARKLWRIDRFQSKTYLLLLSPEKPEFERLSAQFCPDEGKGEIKPYGLLLDRIRPGQKWQFKLRANPVHHVKTEAGNEKRGKIYAHITVFHQKEWLLKKAPDCGFEIVRNDQGHALVDVMKTEHFRFKRQGRYVTLNMVTFEGVLRITDAKLFSRALINGVGRAKAYGCGLLTIARAI